ncbi:MAG: DUF47 family protein [Clostridia bacterium]|nr:DUF47 family protein [Clostridia bacterium]
MADKALKPKKLKRGEFDYFGTMTYISQQAIEASNILKQLVMDLNGLNDKVKEIHTIETHADSKYYEMIDALNKAFITPIDREDIKELAHTIDDVVDSVEDVVMHFYMFNVTTIRPDAVEFCELISEATTALHDTMIEFENYKKSKNIGECIDKLNRLEEKGDVIYREAIRKLFTENLDQLEVFKWNQIFEIMEAACDACERCADAVQGVILKNS